MKKTLFILLLLVIGVGLWFYLLLGDEPRVKENKGGQESEISIVEKEPAEEPSGHDVRATTSADLPPQTDYGMEFPILEE